MTICLTIIAACAVIGVLVALYVLGETVKKCNGWHDRFVEANDSYVRTERRKDDLIKRLRDLETYTIYGVRINDNGGASRLMDYINQNYVPRETYYDSRNSILHDSLSRDYTSPAPTVDATSPEKLAAALVKLQDEELEAAKGAWYRLQKSLEKQLSAEKSGNGPLFTASKPKVAAKALESLVGYNSDPDAHTVMAWLAKHPGETEKLAA